MDEDDAGLHGFLLVLDNGRLNKKEFPFIVHDNGLKGITIFSI